jgi:DNA-binding NtrC family response regulator
MATILIIDDEETFLKNAARFLEKAGHAVTTAMTGRDGLAAFAQCAPDAVVLDFRLPDQDGLRVIKQLRAQDATVPILMITGHGSIELAVEAMKAGANDLLTKPLALSDLRERIGVMTQRQRESSRLQYFEAKQRAADQSIIGESAGIRQLRARISRITEVGNVEGLPPVLITGETGTGKELVARACHFGSQRADQAFIELNCAAIPVNLLESELFGHERGAFTDARERKLGLVEAAEGGTLFLDEIGEMDLGLQAKLLKVIEDRKFRRIGSVHERQVNLRIIAATNQDLEERIRTGRFRADLYFRLRVLQLSVPPLREREGDAILLARHFLAEFSRRYRKAGLTLSRAGESAIVAHAWPGNIRELRNMMEQAVLLCAEAEIGPEDLFLPNPSRQPDRLPEPGSASGSSLDRVEREMLVKALTENGNNVSRAARSLGISRDTLRYRIDKHGLQDNAGLVEAP